MWLDDFKETSQSVTGKLENKILRFKVLMIVNILIMMF
jgi:hypothetical protein